MWIETEEEEREKREATRHSHRGDHLLVRKEKEMIYDQTIAQRESCGENIRAWLAAKTTQELRRFMAGPWTASLLLPEDIEELYKELQWKEALPRYTSEEDFVTMGQD
jgi:hypothetical protein